MYRLLIFCLGLCCVVASAETFPNPRRIPTPVDPDTVMAGDINGDGRPDILYGSGAVANGALHPLLAQADGSYSPGVDIVLPVSFGPACQLWDVNGDTKLDLVCPSYSIKELRVLGRTLEQALQAVNLSWSPFLLSLPDEEAGDTED